MALLTASRVFVWHNLSGVQESFAVFLGSASVDRMPSVVERRNEGGSNDQCGELEVGSKVMRGRRSVECRMRAQRGRRKAANARETLEGRCLCGWVGDADNLA